MWRGQPANDRSQRADARRGRSRCDTVSVAVAGPLSGPFAQSFAVAEPFAFAGSVAIAIAVAQSDADAVAFPQPVAEPVSRAFAEPVTLACRHRLADRA